MGNAVAIFENVTVLKGNSRWWTRPVGVGQVILLADTAPTLPIFPRGPWEDSLQDLFEVFTLLGLVVCWTED